MKTFTLPAKLIKCAMVIQAHQDVRYYLNGVHINKEKSRIEATDGHAAVIAWHEAASQVDESMIVSFLGKIPARAWELDLIFLTDRSGVVEFRNGVGKTLDQIIKFEIIDTDRFPEMDKIRISDQDQIPTSQYGINLCLMERLAKAQRALGQRDYTPVRVTMHGDNKSLIIHPPEHEYKVEFIVMPARA